MKPYPPEKVTHLSYPGIGGWAQFRRHYIFRLKYLEFNILDNLNDLGWWDILGGNVPPNFHRATGTSKYRQVLPQTEYDSWINREHSDHKAAITRKAAALGSNTIVWAPHLSVYPNNPHELGYRQLEAAFFLLWDHRCPTLRSDPEAIW